MQEKKIAWNQSFEQLSKAARGFDLGKVKGLVKVDNIPVAKLDVVDYKNNILNNVTEVYTKQFNATVPNDSHIQNEKLWDVSCGSTWVVCFFKAPPAWKSYGVLPK